jgi:RimJ/RimL family protein N-acetyltransferase
LKDVDLHALPDGRLITIRPIRPDDRERLQLSHERLSDQSRYRRFMTSKPTLSASDASYLVDIDGSDHYALVATVGTPEGEAIVGVARYIRLPSHPEIAEFAIVVGDDWQGQGIARELLGRLADAAVTRGVRRFAATIFADNMPIRHMIDRLTAGPVIRHREGNVLEVEFPLPTRGDDVVIRRGEDERGAPAMIAACAGS